MSAISSRVGSLPLTGLDGSNPLGFLAALGTLVVARWTGEVDACLRWKRHPTWTPVLEGIAACDPGEFSDAVAGVLRGKAVPDEAQLARAQAQASFDVARKAAEEKRGEIRSRRLSPPERKEALETELEPLVQVRDERRDEWLRTLADSVPRPELALGKHIDCRADEYRDHADALLASAGVDSRDAVDLLAAFASDACVEKSGRVSATPFCFITGSGHQYFLDTVRQLMEVAAPERVRRALFEQWEYRDEKLSLRWDPIEAREYALTDTDPSRHPSKTVWMANLLAYFALVLYSSAPRGTRLTTSAWSDRDGIPRFTWPIWEQPAGPDVVRSLLQLRDLTAASPDLRALRARGIAAVFRASRIKVGEGANFKINFSPARAL